MNNTYTTKISRPTDLEEVAAELILDSMGRLPEVEDDNNGLEVDEARISHIVVDGSMPHRSTRVAIGGSEGGVNPSTIIELSQHDPRSVRGPRLNHTSVVHDTSGGDTSTRYSAREARSLDTGVSYSRVSIRRADGKGGVYEHHSQDPRMAVQVGRLAAAHIRKKLG